MGGQFLRGRPARGQKLLLPLGEGWDEGVPGLRIGVVLCPGQGTPSRYPSPSRERELAYACSPCTPDIQTSDCPPVNRQRGGEPVFRAVSCLSRSKHPRGD